MLVGPSGPHLLLPQAHGFSQLHAQHVAFLPSTMSSPPAPGHLLGGCRQILKGASLVTWTHQPLLDPWPSRPEGMTVCWRRLTLLSAQELLRPPDPPSLCHGGRARLKDKRLNAALPEPEKNE